MTYYAPYRIERTVKVYDGARWVWRLMPEKSAEATPSELVVWDDKGKLRISRGTAR
jgi:hypothetical protein